MVQYYLAGARIEDILGNFKYSLSALHFTDLSAYLGFADTEEVNGIKATVGPRKYQYFLSPNRVDDPESKSRAYSLYADLSKAEGLTSIPSVKIVDKFLTVKGNTRRNVQGQYCGDLQAGFVNLPRVFIEESWKVSDRKNYVDGDKAGIEIGIDRWTHVAVHEYYHWFTGLGDTMAFSRGLARFIMKHQAILQHHSSEVQKHKLQIC